MNWYEHHLRDYDASTAHLSWDEDLAYTRLIRWYYRREQPIPADIKEACRQVRATTKVQRDAVATVLREFFELREDGWHQQTCDDVIAEFKAGEPERDAKKRNEEARLAKHRQERADLFAEINAAGEHLPWNASMSELRATVKRIRDRVSGVDLSEPATETATPPETKPATPATAPATLATATHPPPTTHQYPKVNPSGLTHTEGTEPIPREKSADGSVSADPEESQPLSPKGAVCRALRATGMGNLNQEHPVFLALIEAGASPDEFVGAARDAKAKGKLEFAYVVGIVKKRREEAAALVLHKGRMPNRQEAIEQSNRAATAGWVPPELREKTA